MHDFRIRFFLWFPGDALPNLSELSDPVLLPVDLHDDIPPRQNHQQETAFVARSDISDV